MNEVTKLYENAKCTCVKYNLFCDQDECKNGKDYGCEGIEFLPFTAEKQIRIIEWLGNSKAFFDANETIFSLITNYKDKNGVVKGYEGKGNSVDSCLAGLINNLWQDLTEEERKQIKEILE